MAKLHVFRFGDNAYQATSRHVRIGGTSYVVRPNGVAVRPESGELLDDVSPHTLLSTWAEWFDLTLAGAAQDYTRQALTMSRAYIDGSVTGVDSAEQREKNMDRSLAADDALTRVIGAYGMHSLHQLDLRGDGSYLVRVKADIDARLRGEPGEVPEP